MPEQNIKEETFKISPALPGWIGSIICFFIGFVYLFIAPLVSIWLVLAGISVFPPFWKKVKTKWKYNLPTAFKIILLVVFFLIAAAVTPKTQETSSNTNELTPTATLDIQAVQKPTILPTQRTASTPTPTEDCSQYSGTSNYAWCTELQAEGNGSDLKATVSHNNYGVLITNTSSTEWDMCDATLDATGTDNYQSDGFMIAAGATKTIPWGNFANVENQRFNYFQMKPSSVTLDCEVNKQEAKSTFPL